MVTVVILILFPLGLLTLHWLVWRFVPHISTHSLAKAGNFVTIDGIEIYCEKKGEGPPLILIPAGGSHTSTWRFNRDALSKKYQVWTFDLPGSGYSEKPEHFAYTHQAYAKIIRAFMDRMGIRQAVLAGHSMGGTIVLKFGIDYPEKCLGLVLVSSGGYSTDKKPVLLRMNRYPFPSAVMMSFASYPFTVRNSIKDFYYDPQRFVNDTAFINDLCNIYRTENSREAMYWMPKALHWDFGLPDSNRIKSVTIPTLIIGGREDKIVDFTLTDHLHKDLANSTLVIVEKAGHSVHEERPDEFNKAVDSFVSKLNLTASEVGEKHPLWPNT